ncbi:hypothetical protein HYH03_006043 [Edaphochlamys debaryana]|uniref:Uncharacterized protein n=1 Tax=Edaphochlamys debaryana TaxID=47281 RepID=A0A835Y7U6_9CHLO|nr:hypothetical protein HYH03_006043 [Edaphochlamys debaryana]|eukprot:KAG2495801.1 hypothetical protein HYH03_006043 [Edaphochlamys debaryana]
MRSATAPHTPATGLGLPGPRWCVARPRPTVPAAPSVSTPSPRHVATAADRRNSKPKGGSGGGNGSKPQGGRGGGGREARDAARAAELQRAARRGAARAEGVGAGRAALQQRLAAEAADGNSDDEDDGWSRRRRSAALNPAAAAAAALAAGRGRAGKAGPADADLWPSLDAVRGAPLAAPSPSGPSPSGPAAAAGLVAAIRAAAAAERQAKLGALAAAGGGGSPGGGWIAKPKSLQSYGSDAGEAVDEGLVPYADLILKEMGLPARTGPRGRAGVPEAAAPLGGGAEADGDEEEEEEEGGGPRQGGERRAGGLRGRGARRGAVRALMTAYEQVWSRALDLELEEEWTESEERLRSWKRPRLEAEGCALFDLSSASDHALFRDTVLRFFVPGRPLPYHCLGGGDIVLVSPNNKPSEASLEGIVLDFSSRWVRVALPADLAAGVQGTGWRLDLYANTIAHERARGAVKRYCQAAAESGAGSNSASGSDDEGSGGSGGGGGSSGGSAVGLLRALAGAVPAGSSLEQMAAAPPPWLRGKSGRERLTTARRVLAAVSAAAGAAEAKGNGRGRGRGGGGGGLNPSQARAVEAALGRSLTLWQGPPGTGKTATLLQFVRAARAALPSDAGPILATAASNVAVDNIVAGLLAADPSLQLVRVGQPAKVAPALRSVSLEARIAGSGAGQRAAALRKKAQGLRGSEAWAFISQALELEEAAARDILAGAQVVAATCIGAGEARMQALSFPVVVLDEATQATEPHSLVPLLCKAQQVVLVGDPRQLPPTVKSREAQGLGLGLPLFERLQLMGLAPLLLDTQYRMHPALAAFPSAAFYGGKLLSAPRPSERRPPAAFSWPNPEVPVCYIPVRGGRESRTSATNDAAAGGAAGYSYQNDAEAQVVAGVVAALLTPGAPGGLEGPGEIGIVTPYNGQVRCLQSLLPRGGRLAPGRQGSAGAHSRPGSFQRDPPSSGGPAGAEEVLEIKSVDGFQGREKEVIVFSAVRSNPQRALGFVSDPRRLNVAITRAKRGLVVVGDPDTLRSDRLWARWLRWAQARGCWLEEEGAEGRGQRSGEESSGEGEEVEVYA